MAKKISPLMIIPPVIFAGFVALVAVGMFREDPDELPTALAGHPAPAVQITEFPGREGFDDAALRDGKIKLVNFWASWCAPCRVEHPNLEALAAEGMTILGVNYKDQPDKAQKFLAELGDPYTALGADAQGRMALNWGVYGVPETYVVDGDGTILMRFAGPVTQRVIENRLRPVLAEAAAKAD